MRDTPRSPSRRRGAVGSELLRITLPRTWVNKGKHYASTWWEVHLELLPANIKLLLLLYDLARLPHFTIML
jgi:hypothetical protein